MSYGNAMDSWHDSIITGAACDVQQEKAKRMEKKAKKLNKKYPEFTHQECLALVWERDKTGD